jgi:hypothetical protein
VALLIEWIKKKEKETEGRRHQLYDTKNERCPLLLVLLMLLLIDNR